MLNWFTTAVHLFATVFHELWFTSVLSAKVNKNFKKLPFLDIEMASAALCASAGRHQKTDNSC